MDVTLISDKQLKALYNKITVELRAREEAATKFRTEARLVPAEPRFLSQSTRKRFAGGFFTELLSNGRTKGFYAKTKTGIIWKMHNISGEWRKFNGQF